MPRRGTYPPTAGADQTSFHLMRPWDTTQSITTTLSTPCGTLRLLADSETQALTHVLFESGRNRLPSFDDVPTSGSAFVDAARQLDEYFAGERQEFDLPTHITGTPFQRAAWKALLEIPFGQTRTYGQQAQAMGAPRAVRAVGAANGANNIVIIVPCHRVIGADGTLTGYGAGIDRKRWLLAFERSFHQPSLFPSNLEPLNE